MASAFSGVRLAIRIAAAPASAKWRDGMNGASASAHENAKPLRFQSEGLADRKFKTEPVRRVAEKAAVANGDGVDAAGGSRLIGNFVEEWNHGLLVGNRHVESLEADSRISHEGGKARGFHAEGRVVRVKTESAEGRVVHDRGKRMGDRVADDGIKIHKEREMRSFSFGNNRVPD